MKAYVKVIAETSALLGDNIEPVDVYFIVSGRGENDIHHKVSKVMDIIDRRLFNVYARKVVSYREPLNEYVFDLDQAATADYPLFRMEAIKVGKRDPSGLVYCVPRNINLKSTYNQL